MGTATRRWGRTEPIDLLAFVLFELEEEALKVQAGAEFEERACPFQTKSIRGVISLGSISLPHCNLPLQCCQYHVRTENGNPELLQLADFVSIVILLLEPLPHEHLPTTSTPSMLRSADHLH
jgi:hypothetical protein